MRMLLLFFVAVVPACLSVAIPAEADTFRVPIPYATIQEAVDAADAAGGGTVLVGQGTYSTSTNGEAFPIEVKNGVTLISEDGPLDTIIDAEKSALNEGRVIECAGVTATIQGFTIKGAYISQPQPGVHDGAGIWCSQSTLRLAHCVVRDNQASGAGGGIFCLSSTVIFEYCVFLRNSAGDGGGMFCRETSLTVTSCTFHANTVTHDQGGGIYLYDGSHLTMENTIIPFSVDGHAVYCNTDEAACSAQLTCCDVFGNDGGTGDWVGCIQNEYGDDNISVDPLFCDESIDHLSLQPESQCAPGNHPLGFNCGLIGAWGVGCGWPTALSETTWGGVKNSYRGE